MTTTPHATPDSPTATTIANQRRAAIDQALADIRRSVEAGPPDRATLAKVTARLEALAAQGTLFTRADFPPPASGVGESTRYRLNAADGDEGIALYLNSINPGKTTLPHNHTTWAVIVAVQGQEENRLYERTDDGSNPDKAEIRVVRELTVQPGTSVAFLPDDLHSIHVVGTEPTLHFHLYGKPLERLSGRIGIDPATGAVINYNATQFKPSTAAA